MSHMPSIGTVGGLVSVASFGAVGDAVTDDRAAIQSAIDSLGSSGGTVYFPRGNYRVVPVGGFGLTIANPGIAFVGASMLSSKITAAANCSGGLVHLVGGAQVPGTPYTHAAAAAGNASGFSITDLSLVGACVLANLLDYNTATYAVGAAIAADNGGTTNDVSDVYITHCQFSGFDQCVISSFSANLPTAYRWTVRDCKFLGLNPTDFSTLPKLHHPVRLCAQDCLIEGNSMDGFTYGVSLYPCAQSLAIAGACRVLANRITLAVAHDVGIYMALANECTIANNNVTAPAGRVPNYSGGVSGDGGIKVSANANGAGCGDVLVEGNTLRGCQMKISSMQNARIRGNTVIDSPSYGLMIDVAVTSTIPAPFEYQLAITGNHFINPAGTAISASGTAIKYNQLLIAGNIVVNPGGFGIKLDTARSALIADNELFYTDYTQPAGTVALSSGSATVTGTGTAFTAFDVGRKIVVDGTTYTIATFSSGTSVTVTPNAVRTNAVATFRFLFAGPEGTVATTNGSSAITGSGTSFRSSDVGRTMVIDGQNYIVATVLGSSSLTLTTTISTATNPAATFTWNLGTVSIVSGSPTVTGANTSFLPSDAGRLVTIAANSYTVLSVSSATSMTLTSNAVTTSPGVGWAWAQSQCIFLTTCDDVEVSRNVVDWNANTTQVDSAFQSFGVCRDLRVRDNTIIGFRLGVRFGADTTHSVIDGNFIRCRVVNNTDNAVFLDAPATAVGLVVSNNNCYGYGQSSTSNTARWSQNIFGASLAPTDLTGAPAPTITANAAAGTTPTVSIVGTDREGRIVVTTGTAPAASNDLCTITYKTPIASAGYPVITPVGAIAGALALQPFVSLSDTVSFRLGVGATPLAASTTYNWNYRV